MSQLEGPRPTETRCDEPRLGPIRAAGWLRLGLGVTVATLVGLAAEHLIPGHHVHLSSGQARHHHHFFLGEHEHEEPHDQSPPAAPDRDHPRQPPTPSLLLVGPAIGQPATAPAVIAALEPSAFLDSPASTFCPSLALPHQGSPRGPPV